MRLRTAMAVTLVAMLGTTSAGAGEFPVIGAHGFDWTRPQKARCRRITADDVARFKPCTFAPSGAFGLDLAYHSCPRKAGGEVIVLATPGACREALDTMQANAP